MSEQKKDEKELKRKERKLSRLSAKDKRLNFWHGTLTKAEKIAKLLCILSFYIVAYLVARSICGGSLKGMSLGQIVSEVTDEMNIMVLGIWLVGSVALFILMRYVIDRIFTPILSGIVFKEHDVYNAMCENEIDIKKINARKVNGYTQEAADVVMKKFMLSSNYVLNPFRA